MDERLTQRGPLTTGHRLRPIADVFADVVAGADPWLALGNFLDDWRRAERDQRQALLDAPIVLPEGAQEQLRRWAALLVAVADWLCWQDEPRLNAPRWLADDSFRLDQPWFVVPGEKMQVWQLVHSPTPFRLRNIFTDESVTRRS